MAFGGLVGLWLGGAVGGLIEYERPLYVSAPVAPEDAKRIASSDIPAAPDSSKGAAAPDSSRTAVAQEPTSSVAATDRVAARSLVSEEEGPTVWLVSQATFSKPMGSFRPSGPAGTLGFVFQASFVPVRSPISARVEGGMAWYRGGQSGVSADVLGGGSSTPLEISLGTDLYWLMAGPQWGLRPGKSGGYLFGMIGMVNVRPKGTAHWGQTLIYEMEGLPSNSMSPAVAAGGGYRLLLGGPKSMAITTELDYLRCGDTEYMGEPGVEGGNSSPRFAARRGPVQTLTFQMGLARQWGRH